jgi:hypothetical protein
MSRLKLFKKKSVVTREKEILGSSNGEPRQMYTLSRRFVPYVDIWVNELGDLSEEEIIKIIRKNELDVEEVHDENGNTIEFWVKWQATDNLSKSSGHVRQYELDSASGIVRFGDGQHGAIPPAGTDNIKASYKSGGGEAGNIPKEGALRLCQQVREENRGRWYSFYFWWCWGCYLFSRGNPDKLCFSNRTNNRGCCQVNKRYNGA